MRKPWTVIVLLLLVLNNIPFLVRPVSPQGVANQHVRSPLTGQSAFLGPFRTRVTLPNPTSRARLDELEVVVLEEGPGWAMVLADADQLEALARLRFEPQATDDLGMLIETRGWEKPGLVASVQPLLARAAAVCALDIASEGVCAPAQTALRSAMHALSIEAQAGIASFSAVDDDADGLTNIQEEWWCTDPLNHDSDGDGVSDGNEVAALKAWLANEAAGPPASGKPFAGWPPQIPGCRDDDQDSVPDMAERWELGLNMNRESTDRDKFDDGQELFGNTYCPGSGGYCGYGALPRNEDWGVIFAEMPSWVKAPGNHPLVAAFPVPEIDVVQSSLHVETVTTVTTDHTISEGTERSYSTSKTEGTSDSVANTVSWNEWEETSVSVPQTGQLSLAHSLSARAGARTNNLWKFLTGSSKVIKALGTLSDIATGMDLAWKAGKAIGYGINWMVYQGALLANGQPLDLDFSPDDFGIDIAQSQDRTNYCNPCSGKAAGSQPAGSQSYLNSQASYGQTQDLPAYASPHIPIVDGNGQTRIQMAYPVYQPVPMVTSTKGQSHGGAQTNTHTEYEEHTITNGEAFSNQESWGTATAVDSSHAANLWFTYKVRNTGTEYAREIAGLAFNIYIGDDPNPAYTYFVANDVGGDGKFHNFMPDEEHIYTSARIPLTLEQMKAVDLGGPVRIVVEDYTYGIDELFYQDAANAGVLIAIEDGTDDGDEKIDTYLIPTWGTETVLDVLARYFPHTTDADGNLIAIWTPEYRSETPAWCNEPRRVGATLWCRHALSTADWWNVYTNGLGDGSEGFQDTPAAPGSVALFRFNKDSDLDGYSDRSERRLGTDPNDPADHPRPELIAGVHSIRSGNHVTATLSLLNTGPYDAYGVEAVMIAPDDSVSITNNTVGGSGRVRAQKQVIVGSRIRLQDPLPAAWTQPGHAVPAAAGYYTGQQDRTYTFTVQCADSAGCDVGSGSWTLAWDDGAGASGTLNFGAGYASPTFLDVGTLGVRLALYSGKVYNSESFTVEARTPRDTFQYTINREPYTEPVVIVSYNDPQGNHKFVTPVRLSSPTEDLVPHSGKMIHEGAGVEIVTDGPFTPTLPMTTTLVVQAPTRLVDAHLFLEFIDPNGTVVREEATTVTLEPGPNVVSIPWNSNNFNPAYDPNQDYIVMAFFTDWQGNILDTAARPLSSFQEDPRPAFALDETATIWDFGSVPQGTILTHTFTLANTGLMDLKTTVMGTGVRTDQNVPGNPVWTDTGLDVAAGDALGIRASGTVCYGTDSLCYGPDGDGNPAPSDWNAPGVSKFSLIAKIGDGAPFFVGSTYVGTAPSGGRLYLGTNECNGCYGDNGGSYRAHIEIQGLPTSFQGRPSFSVSPADATDLDVTLDTYYLPAGPFNRSILVRTSDPAHPTQTFQVQGTVEPYVAPARSMPVSPYRPWDQRVAVAGDHQARDVVTFDDTIAADATDVHPLRVYDDARQTALGAGREVAAAVASGGITASATEVGMPISDVSPGDVSQRDAGDAVATPAAGGSTPSSVFGDGSDGDLVVGSGQTVYVDSVRTAVAGTAAAGQRVIPVASTAGFRVGDEVLIIQIQGTGAGNYEFATIASIGSNSLTLTENLRYSYSSSSPSATLYEHPNFSGRAETFTGDDPCLTDNYIGNDTASSINVLPGTTAILYEHCDYGGVAETFTADDPDLGNNSIGHDRTSAIRISSNWSRAQVVRVPHYRNVTVQGQGVLTAHSWDGDTGGILAFRASGTVAVQTGGTIDVSEAGFRGGREENAPAYRGEGTAGPSLRGNDANGNGGGGGGDWNESANWGAGGGGGGNGTPGQRGADVNSGGHYTGGAGGASAGNPELTNMVFGGGGGGPTQCCDPRYGGNGGGIIVIFARQLEVLGSIKSNGGIGQSNLGRPWEEGARTGGGGAGGSILIKGANVLIGSNRVNAVGGGTEPLTNPIHFDGGHGGDGRIRIEYCDTFSGSTNPPASVAKINFCYGTVAGKVFRDNNGNGVQDAGEPGMAGIAVSLSGVGQTATDGNGNYYFTANAPANYTLSVTPPAGYDCVTPCSVNVSLQVDQTTTVDFALRPRASVAGKVFHDTNNNGVQDTGESGVAGVTVTLDGTGQTRTTASDGSYSFDQLLPGDYSVSVTIPDGYVNTTPTTVSCNLSAGSVCTANFGILMYTIEKVAGSEHQNRLFMPESFRGGRRYWVQYGRKMAFGAAGQQQAQVQLPMAHYGNVTMDMWLTGPASQNTFVQLDLDVGCDGTSEWGKNANLAIPTTLSTSNLALGVNRFLAGATPDANGMVTVPLCLTSNIAATLFLTNLAATPDGLGDVAVAPADVTLNPTNPTEGDTVTIQAILHNPTVWDSGGLVVSAFAIPPGGNEWYVGSAFVPDVPAGGTAQASIPWNTLGFAGAIPVRVVADPHDRVAETDENNNVVTATLTVLTRPDLWVPQVTLSDDEPVVGEAVTVTLTLRNKGQTTAGAQTVALYQGSPESGGTLVGDYGAPPLPGGVTTTIAFTWVPTATGSHRLFAISDRDDAVNEYDEGNNQTWRDVYVGFAGPILLDSGGEPDPPYTSTLGYGYLNAGTRVVACGTGPEDTLRAANSDTLFYRFDHLLPGHFYHLDITLRDCDGSRAEAVYVDDSLVAPAVDLSDHQPHRISIRLDPALYADHTIVVGIREIHGLDAMVAGVSLHDVDYRYADAGGMNDPTYPAPGAERPYGWLDGEPLTTWGSLPYQTARMDRADTDPGDDPDNELRYRFDSLQPDKRYRLHLTFRQMTGATVVQKVQIDGTDASPSFNLDHGRTYTVTLSVPPEAYAADGSVIVGIVRVDCVTSEAFVNEIALEEETLPAGDPCAGVTPTPHRTIAYGSVTIGGEPAPVGTVIQALNPRDEVVGCAVVQQAGQYPYLQIYGEDPPIPGMRAGEIVEFRVNGIPAVAEPSLYWQDDKTPHLVDLSIGSTEGQCIWLQPNWNLTSFRLRPPVPPVEDVLRSIDGRYCRVLGETGVYDCEIDPIYRTLTEMEPGLGYYVRLTTTMGANLRVEGLPVPVTTPLPLHPYWNWVGYLPTVTLPITQALQSIDGHYLLVHSIDKTYNPADPIHSTLWEMKPGQGYLIRASDPVTLTYPAGTGSVQAQALPTERAKMSTCDSVSPTPYFTLVYGGLTINGKPAPVGTRVELVTPRGEVAGCFVVRYAGEYGYVHAYGEDPSDLPIPGFREGEPLAFRVNGLPATPSETLFWQNDLTPHNVDLSLTVHYLYLPVVTRSQ